MNVDKEIEAMQEIAGALSGFENEELPVVHRILRWACERYGIRDVGQLDEHRKPGEQENGALTGSSSAFEDVADLYHAASPRTDPERALTAGYWFQILQGQADFRAQQLNSALKGLGHGVGNITDALTALSRRKPGLVMQTGKRGSSKQARKRYKLTNAGIREMEGRIAEAPCTTDE